jgi:hypothetical protein
MAPDSNVVFGKEQLVGSILSFLPFSFRFTAAVNRRFRESYRMVHNGNTTTTFQHCVHNVATAEIWWRESQIDADHRLNLAALFGRLEVMKFLQRGWHTAGTWRYETTNYAAQGGHLACLKWMRAKKPYGSAYYKAGQCDWDGGTTYRAAENGHLETLEWAIDNGCEWDEDYIIQIAARKGHLHILEWARKRGYTISRGNIVYAATNKHLHVLQWAKAKDLKMDIKSMIRSAVYNGNLCILQWVRGDGHDVDHDFCMQMAAKFGHLHILKWTKENGGRWNKEICSLAVRFGHLHIMQWAVANGCPWDRRICSDLAQRNLQYIRTDRNIMICDWIKNYAGY